MQGKIAITKCPWGGQRFLAAGGEEACVWPSTVRPMQPVAMRKESNLKPKVGKMQHSANG